MSLCANHNYMLTQVKRLGPAKALDFGCGSGALVAEGIKQGISFSGTEVFTRQGCRDAAAEAGLLGVHVHEVRDAHQPFDDDTFDVVCSNMVFEHLPEIDPVLAEIRRVLKPGGTFLNIFPSLEVVREGHCGIPLSHRLNRWPSVQTKYLFAWRRLGFGYLKGQRTHKDWAAHFSSYLRNETAYRPWREIRAAYFRNGFTQVSRHEDDYAAFRLRSRHPSAAAVATAPVTRWFTKRLVRRLATMVVSAQ
jgi:SAM-dependent methyltransferase